MVTFPRDFALLDSEQDLLEGLLLSLAGDPWLWCTALVLETGYSMLDGQEDFWLVNMEYDVSTIVWLVIK